MPSPPDSPSTFPRLVGRAVERVEDAALLPGRGRFADDVGERPGTAHAAVLRSPHAHAEIVSLDAAEEAAQVVADGIRWLQINVPGVPDEDLKIVKAIRAAVGDDVNFFPDINRGYLNAKTAINSIKAMRDEAGIVAVEQPVEGIGTMARITRAVDIPVIVDEGCWSPQDAMEIVRQGSADVLSIYFTKAGGLIRSMEIGAIGRGAGLPVNVNGSLEGGVGNAANLHLSAALEGEVLPGVITVNYAERARADPGRRRLLHRRCHHRAVQVRGRLSRSAGQARPRCRAR